jgi:hypothetical protein
VPLSVGCCGWCEMDGTRFREPVVNVIGKKEEDL